MRGKDDLFHLIKAMSRSEKRYFTLDAKKTGKEGAKYLELFQAVNGMEEYDEPKLKKKFPRNLSSDKGYLYEAILRSMRDYRSSKSKAAQIKERLMDSRYLYERGLYDQFEDRLKEAKALVNLLEDKFSLLEINKEEQLAKQNLTAYSQEYLKRLEQLNLEKEGTIKAVLEELKYLDWYFRLFVEVTREFVLKEESRKAELRRWVPKEFEKGAYQPESAHAKLRFLKCKALYNQLIGNNDEVFESWLKVVDWWDKRPDYKEEEFFRYIIDVSNLLNTCFVNKKYYHLVPKLLERMEKEKPRNFHEQGVLFHKISISKLLYYFSQNDFESAKSLVPEIEKGLRKFNFTKDIVIIGNIAILFFVTKDYEDCARWSKKIIELKTGKRRDIQRVMRLFNLVALYETGDIDKLDSAMRSITRFFKKNEVSPNSFEVRVFGYLKKIFSAPIIRKKYFLAELRTYLKAKKDHPDTGKLLGLEELLVWLEGKI